MISLSLLRVHAQAATPGPWVAQTTRNSRWFTVTPDYLLDPIRAEEVRANVDADAAFIAAADPAVVLALVEAVEAALHAHIQTPSAGCPECDRLRAALEPFTAGGPE